MLLYNGELPIKYNLKLPLVGDWLIDWLVDWSVFRSVGRSVYWLIDWSIDWSINSAPLALFHYMNVYFASKADK